MAPAQRHAGDGLPARRPVAAAACAALLLTAPFARAASADAAGLQALLQQLAAEQRVCAAAVATVGDGQLQSVATASGCGALQPPDANTVFQAASLGKPVFAYAVLKLAAQGVIDLDAPVSNVLPDGYLHRQNPFDGRNPPITDRVAAAALARITPRMLLQHTAGLAAWSHGPLAFDFAPGSRWQYSGEGYVLLQRVVEAVTGQTIGATLREQVFEPLAMSHSAFSWTEPMQPLLAAGTAKGGKALAAVQFSAPVVAATLYTTAPDYGRFLAALLGDRQLLRAVVASPVVDVDPALGLAWGVGWGLERGDGEERSWRLWHWGSNPGYRAFVMASPASGNAVVLLTNSDNGLAIAEPIVAAVLPGRHDAFRFRMVGGGWFCRTFGWCSS